MSRLRLATAAAALLAANAAFAAPVSYGIDPTHTFARFSYNHLGLSTQLSRFDKTTGTVVFDKAAKTGSEPPLRISRTRPGWPVEASKRSTSNCETPTSSRARRTPRSRAASTITRWPSACSSASRKSRTLPTNHRAWSRATGPT